MAIRVVDFKTVSAEGLESSPVAQALAGLRANESRYFFNKFKHTFVTVPVEEAPQIVQWVNGILQERDLEITDEPLEVSAFEVEGVVWTYVFYKSGLSINVLYSLESDGKRAVGFKLSDGMDIPSALEGKFKFARQRSKLAGTIRGSYFVIRGEYDTSTVLRAMPEV